ncbi:MULTISPECIES: hypothetical protein [Sorangium]|uniref:hypothetical protein n=1 Tax=Sorangium TaxID=39643 RepID=UPI003D9C3028
MARLNTNNAGLSKAHWPGARLPNSTGFGVFTWRMDVVRILYPACTAGASAGLA